MWISVLLVFAFGYASNLVAGKIDGCQILQTTDPRTPCHILIKQAPGGKPPFVYMFNLPRPTPQMPCPVSQTLDASFTCYVPSATVDDPAFIMNVPLPPGADEIDESPAGKARYREAKVTPLFRKIGNPLDFGMGREIGLVQQRKLPEPFRQPQQQIGLTQQFEPFRPTETLGFNTAGSLSHFDKQSQPISQSQPFGRTQSIGQSQPSFSSPSYQMYSTRQPQPIGLTQSVGQTRPIGPPSPQLTKAVFKPLTPSLPQIQPPAPQNQIIFRTVPTLFNTQHTEASVPNFPRTESFNRIIQYQNQQPLYYTSFTQSTQKGSFPYPSSKGRGSITAFQGSYPPKH